MNSTPETEPLELEATEASVPRRRRGERGKDTQPRASSRFSPQSIIMAAGKAGFGSVTIDKDGKITVHKSRPAADGGAGDDKGEAEWNDWAKEAAAKAGQADE